MMSGIKLVYYDGRGRAETIRFVLAMAGKEYEDKRIKPGKSWHLENMTSIYFKIVEEMVDLKPTLPMGQLPVLEYNGETLCQSMAIARWDPLYQYSTMPCTDSHLHPLFMFKVPCSWVWPCWSNIPGAGSRWWGGGLHHWHPTGDCKKTTFNKWNKDIIETPYFSTKSTSPRMRKRRRPCWPSWRKRRFQSIW